MKIREATRDDEAAIGTLAKEFADYLRSLGDTAGFGFNASTYLRDGFGDNPAFQGLVAEIDNEVVGYLLYNPRYDTDLAMRTLYIIDLYVHPTNRLQGVGKALMKRAGDICTAAGGKGLLWSVYSPNRPALDFYEHLGARYVKDVAYMYLPLEGESSQ
ncbi:MAG TPA: GNAT family N-acetyltransferase [Dehalococcoidia bacterium]|nr:GNAT family N-acetyltransferase [Dehalococcoidia bacterium]